MSSVLLAPSWFVSPALSVSVPTLIGFESTVTRECKLLTEACSPWFVVFDCRFLLDDIAAIALVTLEGLSDDDFFTLDDRRIRLFTPVICDSQRRQGLLQLRFVCTAQHTVQVAR